MSRQAWSTLSAKTSEMESDQESEEEGRGAGTCSSSSAPMRSTERLRCVDGSALRLPGVLRWGDEALGRETLQLVGSDRDSDGLSLRWPLAIAHESDRDNTTFCDEKLRVFNSDRPACI